MANVSQDILNKVKGLCASDPNLLAEILQYAITQHLIQTYGELPLRIYLYPPAWGLFKAWLQMQTASYQLSMYSSMNDLEHGTLAGVEIYPSVLLPLTPAELGWVAGRVSNYII